MAAGPLITTFRNRTGLLTFYAVVGAALIVQGVLTAAYFVVYGGEDGWITLVIYGLAAALVCFGLWFLQYGLRRLRDREPPITISAAGLYDRALSERPIPWSDIRDLSVWTGKGGPVVAFDLVDGAAERAGVYRGATASAAFSRTFAHNYHIRSMGTDATIESLVAAIAPFATVRTDGD